MLKKEVIKANTVLASLTDEQIAAIEQLSKNDEDTVIGQKVGEIHRQYDDTILKATGVARNGDEKSYNYLERAAGELKTKAESVSQLQTQISDLTKEKARLEKAVQENAGDAELKNQLKSVKAELEQTKTQFVEVQTKYTTLEKESNEKLLQKDVDFEIGKALTGLEFKDGLPKSATDVLLQQAVEKIKKTTPPEFIDDGKGGKRLVFKDANGVVQNNPENKLEPFTASELLNRELKAMGILKEGRQQQGGGTQPPAGGNGGSAVLDLSGAKTRVEANEAISKHLLSQGLTKGSQEFQDQTTQLWKDNNVAQLPDK